MNIPNKNTQNATLILQRVKDLANIRRDAQLASALGIKPTTLSNYKRRNSIDYNLIINFCKQRGFDLNYVFLAKKGTNDYLDPSTPVEQIASILIEKVRGEFVNELQKITSLQKELEATLDKHKTKEEIEISKKKVAKASTKD